MHEHSTQRGANLSASGAGLLGLLQIQRGFGDCDNPKDELDKIIIENLRKFSPIAVEDYLRLGAVCDFGDMVVDMVAEGLIDKSKADQINETFSYLIGDPNYESLVEYRDEC